VLKHLTVRGFKSLLDASISFPRLTVLFGPNASGKSNVLDAVQALSRIGTSRTLSEAFADPIRGHPIEAFSFRSGGLAALLSNEFAEFAIEAQLDVARERYLYKVVVAIQPGSGSLSVNDEFLSTLGGRGNPKGTPSVERKNGHLRIQRKSKPAHPREEPIGINHSVLSDPRFAGVEYRGIERCREELSGWRTYYLDPRISMRSARPPADVRDIGVLGEDIGPFLYRLSAEKPKHFETVKRTLRSLIPGIEDLTVDLDKRRGTLDIFTRQGGIEFSSRIISEGTLRVLALCAIAANPWSGALLAFEEPENGVHPRRIELIAQLLSSLAVNQDRQLIVTTHSPLFCDAMLKQTREHRGQISLLNVRREHGGTAIKKFEPTGPLFRDQEVAKALKAGTEDGLFESLMLRGMIDE
jgi:predicted ATPase